MKGKKILAIILSLTMVIAMFAGCGTGSGSKDVITLTCYTQLANTSGEQTGWFAQLLEEKFNVKLIIVSEQDGTFETRMEEGDLGDLVIWGDDGDNYLNAIKAGLLLDWEEDDLLADYGSYIQENMHDALEKNRSISPDGKVYGFGHSVATSSKDHQDFMYSWDLRWDLYQELGCPTIKDLDDYYDMLVEMKKLCPTDDNGNETYAFSIWPDWDGNMVMYVKSMVTAYYGYDEFCLGNLDAVTGKFYGCLDDDSPYIEMLAFFNKLYRGGLLDPNSMTQDYTLMSEKLASGGVFASIFNYAGGDGYNTEEHIAANKLMTAVAPEDANPIVYGLSTLGGNRVWSIGANTQYPELCMEIINWMCTPEGRMESEYGPKGLIWDYDENGNTYFTDYGKKVRNDSSIDMSAESDYSGTWTDGRQAINNITWAADAKNPDSNNETYNWKYWASNLSSVRNDAEQAWRDWTGCLSVNQYMESRGKYSVMPETTYSSGSRSDELELTWNNVTNCIVNGSWNAIYAESEGEFQYYIKTMQSDAKRYGYDDCIDWSLEEAEKKYALISALSN